MKKNLLSTALIALMALFSMPQSAWADIDFGTEETVSTTMTWTFNSYTTSATVSTCPEENTKPQINKLYNRSAASGRGFTISEISETSLTFSDGYVVSVTKKASSSAAYNNNNMNAKTAGAIGNESTPYFAFNAKVAGTCYAFIKNTGTSRICFGKADGTTSIVYTTSTSTEIAEVKYTSNGEGVFFIGPVSSNSCEIYAIRFVPTEITVSEEKTWTFNDISTSFTTPSAVVNMGDGIYVRGAANRNVSFLSVAEANKAQSFSDGTDATCEVMAVTGSAVGGTSNAVVDASSSGTDLTPSIAFKTTVPGTVYAIMQMTAAGSSNKARIHFCDGTSNQTTLISPVWNHTTITELKGSSTTAGSFFVTSGGNACNIYAVRFVPESVSAPTIKNNNGTVTITGGTSSVGGTVTTYYTTDESDPTSSSTPYSDAVPIPSSCTVKAISISSTGKKSDITSLTVTIPTALTANSVSFAGLSTDAITTDDETNFTIDTTNKKYQTNSASASAISANGVTFCSNTSGKTFTLSGNYINYDGTGATITIPGLTTGQTVFAKLGGANSDATTYTCSGGSFIGVESPVSTTTYSVTTYPAATDVFMTASSDKLVLTNAVGGFRVYRIALAQKLTTAISGPTSTEATISVSPTVSAPAAVTDANLGNGYFVKGTEVTLTPPDIDNYTFSKWTDGSDVEITEGVDETTKALKLTLSADQTVKAVYTQNATLYSVSIDSNLSNGSIVPDVTSAVENATVTLTVTPTAGYKLKSGTLKYTTDGNTYTDIDEPAYLFTMPAGDVTITAEFEALPVYSTYNFKTFATGNITKSGDDGQATPVLLDGIMTGNFTATKGSIADQAMTLNDIFGLSTASDFSLRYNDKDANTGLLMKRSSTSYVTINRLSAGDWFIIENDGNVLFRTANANVKKLGSTSTISANEAVESGTKYIATAATPVELYNNNNSNNSYIYSVTISKDEAISDPEISDRGTDGKVTITAGQSTASGTLKTYYTIDGSTPTSSSTESTAAVAIDQTRIVKAITINTTTSVASDVVTKKITVDALTPATTWDFVNDEDLSSLSFGDAIGVTGYYYNSGDQSNANFINITNSPVHSKMSWLVPDLSAVSVANSDSGISDGNARAFSINDLAVDDKIYITYTSTDGKKVGVSKYGDTGSSHDAKGNTVTIDGTTASAGALTTFDSGAEIVVTAVDNMTSGDITANYVMFKPESKYVKITKIEINPVYSNINIDENISNGMVTADVNRATEGSTVTLTVMPSAGYELSTITVTKASSGTVSVTTVALGSSYTFTMPAEDVTVTATFVEEYKVDAATTWLFDGYTAGTSVVAKDKLYNRSASDRAWAFEELAENDKLTNYSFGGTTINVTTKAVASTDQGNAIDGTRAKYLTAGFTGSKVIGSSSVSLQTEATPFFAFNASVPGTCFALVKSDGTNQVRIFFGKGDGETALTSVNTTSSQVTKISMTSDSQGVFFIGGATPNALREIYAIRFVPAQDTNVTLTATPKTANRTDFKNFTVSNMTAGMTLYYILPGETATRTYSYATNDTTAINNVKKNGYLTYWVTDANGIASTRKTLAVGIAPTVKWTSASASADASTYTLSYTAGNTLHYTLPGGTEQTAGGDTSTSTDVTVTTTGPITAYQTVDDVTSPKLSTNVYAPTPAIAASGKYDFTLLKEKIGSGYTIALGSYPWGDEVTIGDMMLKKPGLMTSKTLDRFAFTYQNSDETSNTNWRLVSDGRLRVAKRMADVYMAILDLKGGEYVTINRNSIDLKYMSQSTAKLADGTDVLTSGQPYKVQSAGHLLLCVPANSTAEFDITMIEIATDETVTAPTLAARTESGVVVPNAVQLTIGTSNFGNTVTAYYTTDGTTPSATNGTAMSASGKVTVDETCTIKAICISTTGVASAVSEYAVTLPQADKTGSVVYDFNSVISKSQALTFSATAASSVQVMEKGTSGWEQKGRSDFYPVTDFDSRISVRVGAESVTYDTEAATVKLIRPMAIHNLGVGDEIVIMYSGTGSVINVNSPAGDVFTVADKTVAVGEEISSGAVIKITKTKYANNYIVVGTSGDVYINAIYINSKAPSTVTRPKVALKDVDGDEAIYNITFDAGARLYYWLSTGEETEYRGSDTGSFDLTISKSATLKAWAQYSGLVSDTLTTVIYAPTPAPSENGDYDFAESSDGLPADMEVQLDAASSVTVSGKTLYKPTALTEQTFQDKFAFTETNTSGKIKIRTNRQLAFSKGTDMNMALLNMKKGDIIAFDYTGTINFADPTLVKADAVAAARAATRGDSDSQMASGTAYVVQQDCNVLMDLVLTSEAVSIAKMYVAAAPGKSDAAAVDFASAAEDEEELEMGGAASVWCAERTAMVKFKRLANSSDNLPIDSKISSENGYGSNTTSGFTSGNRNIAIHALAKGDTIKVRFSGGDVLFYNHASYGNSISRNGKLLVAGDTIHGGDVLKVEKVDYLNNYFVLRLGSGAAISGIFINKQETEKVLMPSATLNSSNALVITSGKSTLGYDVVTNYTTNGTDPSLLNGTGGPYATFEVQLRKNESKTIKVISISESGAMSRILTLTYDGSVLTSIEDVFADREDELTEEKEAVIYDLLGRRVTTMTPGHIYIVNGKKRFYNKR